MYGLHYREELDETTAKEFDSFLARLKSVFLLEHNEDGRHRFDLDQMDEATISKLIEAAQGKGQWWKTGPWMWDDPMSGTPHQVNLRFTLANATYNDFAPTGIDDAIGISIDPSGGNVVLNGLKALNNYPQPRTRILVIRNIDGGANTITLTHEATASVAAFRFDLPNGEDVVLDPGQNVWLMYDPDDERWTAFITGQVGGDVFVVGGSGGSGASVVQYATLTLSDAQCMSGGDFEIVAAPGAGLANIPIRAYLQLTRSNNELLSGNQTGTVRYDGGDLNNLLSSTLDVNFGGSGNTAHKHAIYSGGNYDAGWITTPFTSGYPGNKAIELNLTGPITELGNPITLSLTLVLAYVQVAVPSA